MIDVEITRPGGRRPTSWFVYVPGAALVALGVLIWLIPDLLRFAVACLFVMFGVALLGIAHRMRNGMNINSMLRR